MPEASAAPAAPVAPSNPSDASEGEAQPTQSNAKPTEPKPAPRKLPQPVELKRKGKVEKIDDLDRLVHLAEKGYGAAETFEEVQKTKGEIESKAKLLEAFKTNDPKAIRKALRELGADQGALRAAAEEELWEHIQAEQMSPEQKRIRQLEQEALARKEADEKTASEAKEKEATAKAEAELNRWAKVASDALAAAKVSPDKAPVMLARMRPYIDRAIANGEDPVGADVLEEFMSDERDTVRDIVSGFGDNIEAAAEWVGEDFLNNLRRYDLQRLRAGRQPSPFTPKPQQAANAMQITQPKAKDKSFWKVDPHRE